MFIYRERRVPLPRFAASEIFPPLKRTKVRRLGPFLILRKMPKKSLCERSNLKSQLNGELKASVLLAKSMMQGLGRQ